MSSARARLVSLAAAAIGIEDVFYGPHAILRELTRGIPCRRESGLIFVSSSEDKHRDKVFGFPDVSAGSWIYPPYVPFNFRWRACARAL